MLEIASGLSQLREIEIHHSHRLGKATYECLQRDYELADLHSPAPEYIQDRVDSMHSRNMVDIPIRG